MSGPATGSPADPEKVQAVSNSISVPTIVGSGISADNIGLRERRNRRVEMLETLSLHVASLRARLAQAPSDVRLPSDKVRALCDEIDRQAQTLGDGGLAGADMPTIGRSPA